MKKETELITLPYLIAGLGNPGREHSGNRHNVGFMVIDTLAKELTIKMKRIKHKAVIGTGKLEDRQLLLVKPQTYMNASGQSISPLVRYYKVPLEHLMVIHDDLDIPFGTIRMRPGGGTAGQRGMKSIVTQLGSHDFPRLRIGIGRPPGRMYPKDYVLYNFNADQLALRDEVIQKAAKAVCAFILEGLEKAMNDYNGEIGEALK